MMRTLLFTLLALSWVGIADAGEAPHVRTSLVAGVSSIAPGESFEVLLHQEIDPGWHTYWRNPGDSGAAPEIQWEAPDGVSISEFEWPWPERIPYGPLMNFGYHDEVSLPFTVTLDEDFKGETFTVTGAGRILVCEDICIPQRVSVSLSLPIGATFADEAVKDQLAQVRSRIPAPLGTRGSFTSNEDTIELTVPLPGTGGNRVRDVTYFPFEVDLIDNPAEQQYRFTEEGLNLTLARGYAFDPENADLAGIVVVSESSGNEEVTSSFSFGVGASTQVETGESMGLLAAVVFAFLGGLILNLMPCVFPVLSIKILSLFDAAHESGSSIRLHGLVYAVGVILSFIVIALVLIALRLGGEAIGWGFQLQSPLIVGLLAYLFILIGLNLLGVFEVGMAVMTMAGGAAMSGYGGSFATGVLAAVVAAPCTAPFMGAAVGYALTQSPLVALLVFGSLGAGMAAPYLLLCYSPDLLAKLPQPGRWMQTLKQVMAFPMFASAIWLLWVLGIQTSATGMMQVMAGCLLLALAVWLTAQFRAGSRGAMVSNLVALMLAVVAVYLVAIQEPTASPRQTGVAAGAGEAGVYSAAALDKARQAGPVLVNFTASWCITCKVNELNALNKASVREAMAAKGVTYLKGDWTNEDPRITLAMQAYGRSGVPLYLLYEKGSDRAEVLPQLLTEGIVLDALDQLP